MTPYLLLAALAWAVASRGGTSLRDLVVVLGLLVVALIAGRAWPRRGVVLWAAFAALLCWLVIVGLLRTGWTLETVRVPLLVVIAALIALVVGRMGARERDTLVTGLIIVGCLQSMIALGELAMTLSTELSLSPRAGALLGSANGLGMLLVVTSVLTAREADRHGGWLPVAALLLQAVALLATSSRTAILIASVLLIGYIAAHAGWKRALLGAAGFAAAAAVVVWRTAGGQHEDRPDLWGEALRRIADQPLLGEGPAPAPFTPAVPGARITTYAHNEILQWGVEYGVVGVGLGLLVVILALRSTRRQIGGDLWLRFAALALLSSGLTDFTLRITALALTAAALTALAVTRHGPTTLDAGHLPMSGGSIGGTRPAFSHIPAVPDNSGRTGRSPDETTG
ncbi:O-antigen ligase family protein [Sinomonas sp. ASV322]|uniref:O-antigen ligase family protein n=1 Tax=Sinomonas sp. ASV322 TaxID=3041920 RepID=UPI0027DE2F74|nr:O-antigen ligase family protein [Sinomonas sp. ASV322]MDQ4502356.1 O-antigen ligase family protein [Sinomonas sp. ASV322]